MTLLQGALLAVLLGCGHLREHAHPDTVYVVTQRTYLRDRIAAVANHVAEVTNGEALEVVEHDRRFLKVKTAKGEVGWIEDHLVIDEPTYQAFVQLKQQHQHDPVIVSATLRDDNYLHLKPGRETERFYLLPENDKLQLLMRASLPKPATAGGLPMIFKPAPKSSAVKTSGRTKPGAHTKPQAGPEGPMPKVPMEDWWLVRDGQGKVGWLLGRRMDVDVPDDVAQYSEGQKMVGAYVLNNVTDPDSSLPGRQVPQYVTVLNSYQEGLPYDFDQVRVFTWDVRKHRYETAYRERNIEGYLPVEVSQQAVEGVQAAPVFSIKVATADAPALDPVTGAASPPQTEVLRYALEGQLVKKISPAGEPATPPAAAHPRRARKPEHRRRTVERRKSRVRTRAKAKLA